MKWSNCLTQMFHQSKYDFIMFLTTSHVVIGVLRFAQLLLLMFFFSIFLINHVISLFSIDMPSNCKRMEIVCGL